MKTLKDRISTLKSYSMHLTRSKENNLYSGDDVEYQQVVVFYLGYIDLGDNFTLNHFYDALSIDQLELIANESIDLDAAIRFRAICKYGTIAVHMAGIDHLDLFIPALRKVEY